MRVQEASSSLMSVVFVFLDFRHNNPQNSTRDKHARTVTEQPDSLRFHQVLKQMRGKDRIGCFIIEGDAVTKIPEDEFPALEPGGRIFANLYMS
jgi:hypothetical protein